MSKAYAGDIETGTIIEHEGEAAFVVDIDCAAVDTHMGATYRYTFHVRFVDGTADEFSRWEGDELVVLAPPMEVVD